ncbi:hypothetical protein KEM52_002319, partial [Ascosphaera acerosa]
MAIERQADDPFSFQHLPGNQPLYSPTMSQPPQDAIDQCTLLTGCTRQEAIEFLK